MVLDTESTYWNKLTNEYIMSEESNCSEDENSMTMVTMHVLPWHSQGQYYWFVKNVSTIMLMKNFQYNKYILIHSS